jgi:hypothetical protein
VSEEIPNLSNRTPVMLPGLVASDFSLFRKLKDALAGQEFSCSDDFFWRSGSALTPLGELR